MRAGNSIRDDTASARDLAAQRRDRLAAGRDRKADIADLRVSASDEDHRRAADDRVSAKHDRESGERDRAESRLDREHALAASIERREVERVKDELVSIVSHELRTPLTSLRGSLGLLESGALGELSESASRMVEIAVQNTDRLVRLIDELLDLDQLGSGARSLDAQLCDGGQLIRRAIQCVEQLAAEAEVGLTAECEHVPLRANADRVLQTLTNLIGNAVKFSAAGSTVRLSCTRRKGDVLFRVADDGIGIPAGKIASIFERFEQVDASDSREKGGTGLGLAICHTIVERHGGRIWVDSAVGVGSTFFFTIPARLEP